MSTDVAKAQTATEHPQAGRAPHSALRGLLPFLSPYRVPIALAAVFLVLSAVSTLLFPWALRSLIDNGIAAGDHAAIGERLVALRAHFLWLFGLVVAFGCLAAARLYAVTWIGERVSGDLRNAVFRHVITQSPGFFETTQGGEVLSRLTTDTTLVQTVAGSSLSMGLRSALTGMGALTLLTIHHFSMMLEVWGLLLIVVGPSMYFGRRLRKLSRDSQDRVADSSAMAAEVLQGIHVVQSFTSEGREATRFEKSTDVAVRTALRRTAARSLLIAFMVSAFTGALLYSLYAGTTAVMRGEMSAGQLGQAVTTMLILVNSAAILAEVYGDLQRAAGASERLLELLSTHAVVSSPAQPAPLPPVQGGARVELDHVTFYYPSRPNQPALADFNLSIAPGETVALVGPSGAGKSTVFQLLLRFYDVSAGEIRLDGVPVRALALPALRGRIGIVPQDGVVFSADAAENIRYGDQTASDAQVQAAAKAAHAHEFISRLPEGYKTFLGERGVRLSGGQRQRINIARAMLKNPPLLLLDEATSALDAESERMVQDALSHAMHGRTTLVIAHRLATVLRADRIIVMEAGRIVDVGSHAELLQRGGTYARLAALQFSAAPSEVVQGAPSDA
jgi:ATP-binding cassette subfamily B protein